MRKIVIAGVFAIVGISAFAQQKIVIHGRIALLSKSRNVKISGLPDAAIKPDGSFETSGEIKEPRVAMISTDSSGASSIWLEEGTYTLECWEIKREGIKSALMRIPQLTGPQDAVIYNDYNNASYNGFTNNEHVQSLPALTEEQKKANIEMRQTKAFQYVDSIIEKYPDARVLPNMDTSYKILCG